MFYVFRIFFGLNLDIFAETYILRYKEIGCLKISAFLTVKRKEMFKKLYTFLSLFPIFFSNTLTAN